MTFFRSFTPAVAALLMGSVLSVLALPAHADDAATCQADGGTLVEGTVLSKPKFKSGQFRKGVELSHTHLTLRGAANGQRYDVAIDNVFANGYQRNAKGVPAPLNTIQVGDRVQVCGQPFPGGIHWVHTNCGDRPTPQDPNGWLKKVGADGVPGPNMEGGEAYCTLWPKR